MKKLFISIILLLISLNANAQRKAVRTERPKLPITVTHLLPSALVLPNGTLMLGTVAGVGLFDIFDITTNLYLDIEQVLNANLKANIYKSENYAFALFAGFVSQTVRENYFDAQQGLTIQRSSGSSVITPGAVFSYRILPQLVGHVGGHVAIRNPDVPKSHLANSKTALVQGNTVNAEFSYGINPVVALSLGASQDLSYDITGVGMSVHVGGFQIGAHYYLNVVEGSVLPIIGGGYTAKLD